MSFFYFNSSEWQDFLKLLFRVYANGIPRVSYKFLLKSPRSQNLDLILDDVAAKISAKTGYAVRTLYTTQGLVKIFRKLIN